MSRPKTVEMTEISGGSFKLMLPDDFTGKIEVNCSKGTVVNYHPTEVKRPVKLTGMELREAGR